MRNRHIRNSFHHTVTLASPWRRQDTLPILKRTDPGKASSRANVTIRTLPDLTRLRLCETLFLRLKSSSESPFRSCVMSLYP